MSKVSIPDSEFEKTISSFLGKSFSTYDCVIVLQKTVPGTWSRLVGQYGQGGQGAGTHYSSYSRVAQTLEQWANRGDIEKLDYRTSPPGWGSPKIRYWVIKKELFTQDFPNDIPSPEKIFEGAKQIVAVNRYERDRGARTQCIERWGIKCCVCNFDFEEQYGERGAGFIHVHHLTPISQIGGKYELDPIEHLRPVCPNCHSMLHRTTPPISVEDLKKIMRPT
jgi:hypothetical protein